MAFLLVVANLTGAGMIVPQVLKLRRTRSLDGISSAWIGVGIALNLWWIVYAVASKLWGVLPVSAASAVLYAAMVSPVMSLDRTRGSALVRGAAWLSLVPAIALAFAGWRGAGLAIGLCYAGQFLPATITAVRSPRVDGISRPTWLMALVEAMIWFAYGASTNDPALVIGGAGAAVASLVIVIRVAIGRRDPTQGALAGTATG